MMVKVIIEGGICDSPYFLPQGEEIDVPIDTGTLWCKRGWAQDLSGKVNTGQPDTSNKIVSAENVRNMEHD